MTQLWHYTCDHGRAGIGLEGLLVPAAQLAEVTVPWTGRFVWLTDMPSPMRGPLGLTSWVARCDRTTHRYRVTDASTALRWSDMLRGLPRREREIARALEEVPEARPMHWWVSREPVPVVLDER